MRTSARGIALIKQFEGVRLKPYKDGGGVWTIGYGHTKGVTKNTPEITEEKATLMLVSDLHAAEDIVGLTIKVPLNANQHAALVSLAFNCGAAPFNLTLGKKLNARDYAGAADEFLKWSYDNKKFIQGLHNRRKAERLLFLEPCDTI